MLTDPTIRPYDPDDWAQIALIHDDARLIELQLTVGVAAFATLEQTARDEGLFDGDLWVAEIEDRIVGFLAWADREITWLYVAPDQARKGVGRALLRHAMAERGGPTTVSVLDGNDPALGLYQAEGFKITETRDGRLQGGGDIPARGHWLTRPADGKRP